MYNMGNAHSYMKRHEGKLLEGGNLAGRGAGSWLPCPDGKETGSVGLCQTPCREGYYFDGMLACKKPDFVKPTRVLPPHPGICGGDRPIYIDGLCYGTPPPGYTRKTLGLLDQNCPADKPEWKGYENFNGVVDIGVSCQRATYTRPPNPMLKVSFKHRKNDKIEETPFCDDIEAQQRPRMCRENKPPNEKLKMPGNLPIVTPGATVDGPAWFMSDNGDVYYEKCKLQYYWIKEEKVCSGDAVDDGHGNKRPDSYTPKMEEVKYKIHQLPFCDDLDPKNPLESAKKCIKNPPPIILGPTGATGATGPPPEQEYYFINKEGDFYIKCPIGYDYEDISDNNLRNVDNEKPVNRESQRNMYRKNEVCIKWKPMDKKKVNIRVAGVDKQVDADNVDTYHKTELDRKPADKIKIQFGVPSMKWPMEDKKDILSCADVVTSKNVELCRLSDFPDRPRSTDTNRVAAYIGESEYDISDDIQNFYKKCNEGFKFNHESKKCTKEGSPPQDTHVVAIEYAITMNPLCENVVPTDLNGDMICRENDFPDAADYVKPDYKPKYSISHDGSLYHLNCTKEPGDTFYLPTKTCINRKSMKEYTVDTVPVKYGKPSGKIQEKIIVRYCDEVNSKKEELCIVNRPEAGYVLSDNFMEFHKPCKDGETYVDGIFSKDGNYTKGTCQTKDKKDVPTESVMTSLNFKQTNLCSESSATPDKNKLCRKNAPGEDFYLSEDGEKYIKYCVDNFEYKDGVCAGLVEGVREEYAPETKDVEYDTI